MRIFCTGDTHGNFEFLLEFCKENKTTFEDILIIAGDAGILYYGNDKKKEIATKQFIANMPITLFCIRGNHEARPTQRFPTIQQSWVDAVNGEVYIDPLYPNILFAIDGNDYVINDMSFLTIGGAYSVDKWFRLQRNWYWNKEEELTDLEMMNILHKLNDSSCYDYIITHTCPSKWEPTDLFLSGIDQNSISKRMENFLSIIEDKVYFKHFIWGHFHANRYYDEKHIMLYKKIIELTKPGELKEQFKEEEIWMA